MSRGLFVVLEGGEGAGKGSVLSAVAEWLLAQGIEPLCTRAPGGTAEGQVIRSALVQSGANWEPTAELLMMMADRAQHVGRLIRPALAAGRVVLCDRFVGSTIAYQGGGRGLSSEVILELQKIAADDVAADLTILLDVSPAIGLKRSLKRLAEEKSSEDLFERLDIGFHERVRASFLKQAAADTEHWAVIDASRPIVEVIGDVQARLAERIEQRSADWAGP
ncbi:dTMP kinase [uncultured Nevskia sp.]|uniref:dTMP kinase n=1 Tax=uncultured Nevskia sp. TaxID=228950 RepID=UPI0025D6A4CE|nr:dTMP kinase [uncultured Nevskia sp.]